MSTTAAVAIALATTIGMSLAEFQADTLWLLIVGFIIAFILAFAVGANDVANSFGTTVGAKTLTLRQGCILASIFETLGAILLGAKVGETIRKGIIDADIYRGNEKTLMVGEVSAMIGSGLWQLVATFLKMPVSGTHSIVGACVGFSVVAMGAQGVHWDQLGYIIASWFISPVLAGAMAAIFYWLLRRLIFMKENPIPPGLVAMPILYAATLMINTFSVLHSGSETLRLDDLAIWLQFFIPMVIAAVVYVGVRVIYVPLMVRSIHSERERQMSEAAMKNMSDDNQISVKKVVMPPKLETISEKDPLAEGDLSYESEIKALINGQNSIGAGDAPMKENHVGEKCPSSPKKNGSKNSLGDIKSLKWQSNHVMAEERKMQGRGPRSQSVGDHHVRIPALLQLEKQVLKSRVPEPTIQELKTSIRKNFSEPTMINLAERSGSDFYEVHINRQRRAVTIQRKKRTRTMSGHSESSCTRLADAQLSSTTDVGESNIYNVIPQENHTEQLEEPFDESEDEGTGLVMKSSEDVIVLASDQKSYSGAIEEGFRKLSTCPLPDIIEIKVAGSMDDDCEVGDMKNANIVEEDKEDRVEVRQIFRFLQILTACFGSFAHGGNDVSNAIGPLIALYIIYQSDSAHQEEPTPLWLLLYGGVGICVGLWVWGRRVIKTMGEDLTSLTPSRGFAIELMSAVTVLGASNIGIPVSTTHCKVGAVVAVGWVRSREAVDWKIFRNIVLAWFVTVPVSGGLSAIVFLILRSVIVL